MRRKQVWSKITHIVNETLTLMMHGTTNKNISSAKFYPVYQLSTGRIHCTKAKPRDRKATLWTWDVDMEDDEMIRAVNIQLNKHGKPNAGSLRAMQALHPLTHHVF